MPISAPPELDTMGATSVVVIVILFCYLMHLDGHGGVSRKSSYKDLP